MNHKTKFISVIIVNWNGIQHLKECFESLSKQTIKDYEIILVDNGSTDGSVNFVEREFPHVKIITLNKNYGFCKGNNIGLQHSRGGYIALLNNDTKVESSWLEELMKGMEQDPQIGICASCMVNYYKPDILDTAGDGYDICGIGFKIGNERNILEYQKKREVFGACAGAALYRRSMIEQIGFFDERYFAVGEDIDLSFRAKLAGYKCEYVPTAIVYHKVNQTIGAGSDYLLYQARRNLEYTYFKNMPILLLFFTITFHLLYNLITFVQALIVGKIRIYLKAKQDFIAVFNDILKERRKIQRQRKVSLKYLIASFSKDYLIKKSILELIKYNSISNKRKN